MGTYPLAGTFIIPSKNFRRWNENSICANEFVANGAKWGYSNFGGYVCYSGARHTTKKKMVFGR